MDKEMEQENKSTEPKNEYLKKFSKTENGWPWLSEANASRPGPLPTFVPP